MASRKFARAKTRRLKTGGSGYSADFASARLPKSPGSSRGSIGNMGLAKTPVGAWTQRNQ